MLVVALYCLEAIVMHSVIVMHRVLPKRDHCRPIDDAHEDDDDAHGDDDDDK